MKKFITIAAVVAFAVLGTVNTTNAATSQEALEAQIQALLAQLAGMQTGGTTTMTGSAFVFSGTMRAGMKGPGVATLQAALNSVQTMQIQVDSSFGPATASAVKQFQASQGLAADGIVGPATGAALAAATSTVITIPTGGLPAGCTSTAGYSSTTGVKCDSGAGTLPAGCTTASGYSSTTGEKCEVTTGGDFGNTSGKEADLKTVKVRFEDNAEAGMRGEKVASFELDLGRNSGDIQLNRVDLDVTVTAATPGTTEDRVFRIFDAISIADANGKVLATARANSRNDWTGLSGGSQSGVIRISGIDAVAKGDARTEFQVLVDTARLSDSDLDIAVAMLVDGFRYTEETGAIVSESSSFASGNGNFLIEGEQSADLKVVRSNNNPKESNIGGSDSDQTNDATVFIFNAESRKVDFEIDEVVVEADIVAAGTGSPSDLVRRARLYNGSKEIASATIQTNGSAPAFKFVFDARDFELRKDRVEEFSVKLDLAKIDGTIIANGSTIKVTGVTVKGYDENDVSVTKSTTNNVQHTFGLEVVSKVKGNYSAPVQDGAVIVKQGFISITLEVGEAADGKMVTNSSGVLTGVTGTETGVSGGVTKALYEDDGTTPVAGTNNYTVYEGQEYVYVVTFDTEAGYPLPKIEMTQFAGMTVTGVSYTK